MPSYKRIHYVVGGYIISDREPTAGSGNCDWFAVNIKFENRNDVLSFIREKRKHYKKYNKSPTFRLQKETVECWENIK